MRTGVTVSSAWDAQARLLVGAISFLAFFNLTSVAASLPAIQADLGVSQDQARAVYAVGSAGMATGFLISGPASDRMGRRALLLFSLALLIAGSVAAGLCKSFSQLLAARLVQSGGAGAALILVPAVLHDIHGTDDRGMLDGNIYASLCMSLGGIAGVVAGAAFQTLHWQWTFPVIGALGIACAILVWLWNGSRAHLERSFQRISPAFTSRVVGPALIGAASLAVVHSFAATTPSFVITQAGLPVTMYAAVGVLSPATIVAVSYWLRWRSRQGQSPPSASAAALALLVACLFATGLSAAGLMALVSFLLLGIAAAATSAFMVPYSTSLALGHSNAQRSGLISSVVGAIHMGGSASGAALGAPADDWLPGLGLAGASLLALLICVKHDRTS